MLINRPAKKRSRLQLESLEDRRLLAVAPELVIDANQKGAGALVRDLTPAAEQTFFFSGDVQLWRTDGTPDGTRLVVDFANTGLIAAPGIVPFGNSAVFTLGNELWISDGSAEGTQRLHTDLRLTQYQYYGGLSAEWNGALYFSATSSTTGAELWHTDGTADGTRLVVDMNPGTANGDATSITVFKDRLFFAALDNSNSRDVWEIDELGVASRFLDLPFQDQGVFLPMAVANDTLFIAVGSSFIPQTRRTVWTSDGTAAETRKLSAISSQIPDQSIGGPLMVVGDQVYMATYRFGSYYLATSDGTAAGTALLTPPQRHVTFNPVRSHADLDGKILVALAEPDRPCDYWMSDGTVQGTSLIPVFPRFSNCFGSIASVGSIGYFGHNDLLWKTDGTEAGTSPVDPDFPGGDDADVLSIVRAGDQVLFTASDPRYGRQLFSTDGTALGTSRLTDIVTASNGSEAGHLAATHDRLFFNAFSLGSKIFSSDGQSDGTFPLWNLDVIDPWENRHDAPFDISPVKTTKTLAFFVSTDLDHGKTLNVADGAAPEYARLLTIDPERYVSMDYASDQHLFFHFTDVNGAAVSGPWVSDGTVAGTHALEGLPDEGGVRATKHLSLDGETYFVATFISDQTERSELWRFDAAADSAEQVTDFGGRQFCGQLATDDLDLFASLSTPELGCELWRIDGESFETTLVDDLRLDELGSNPSYMVGHDGDLYFVALTSPAPHVYDRAFLRLHGDELVPLAAGFWSFSPGIFVNGDYYFTKQDDASLGYRLWRTDGTPEGTAAISTSPTEAVHPRVFATTGGHVFYLVRTSIDTAQMWQTDGTPEGTHAIPDLVVPYQEGVITTLNGAVYFSADDGIHGTELWKLAPPAGDTNFDGLVDLADLNNVRNHFGETGSVLGDANGDGVVDLEDLNAVRNNFGAAPIAVANQRFPNPRRAAQPAPRTAKHEQAYDLLFVTAHANAENSAISKPTAKRLRAIDHVFATR